MNHDDTTELPTYTRAVGGTDPHPVTVEELIGRIDAQLDTVWAAAELRGYVTGAQALVDAAHELTLLAQSLEGRASEHAEMLRSTAEAVHAPDPHDYDAVMDRVHGEAS